MPDEQPGFFAQQGNLARPAPGDYVPLAVVETIAKMLGEHWQLFEKQWQRFGDTLDEINAKIAELARVSHEAPCNAMREHREWHEEQSREMRTFRRQMFYIVIGALLTFSLTMLAWFLKG